MKRSTLVTFANGNLVVSLTPHISIEPVTKPDISDLLKVNYTKLKMESNTIGKLVKKRRLFFHRLLS